MDVGYAYSKVLGIKPHNGFFKQNNSLKDDALIYAHNRYDRVAFVTLDSLLKTSIMLI